MAESLVQVEEKFGSLEDSLIERLSSCQKNIINILTVNHDNLDAQDHTYAKEGAMELLYSIIDKKDGIINNLTRKNIELTQEIGKRTDSLDHTQKQVKECNEGSTIHSIVVEERISENDNLPEVQDDSQSTGTEVGAHYVNSTVDKRDKCVSYTNPWCPRCKEAMSLKDRYVECGTCRSLVHPEFSNLPTCCLDSLEESKRAYICKLCMFTSDDVSAKYMNHISTNRDCAKLKYCEKDVKVQQEGKEYSSTNVFSTKQIKGKNGTGGNFSETEIILTFDSELDLDELQLPTVSISDGVVSIDLNNLTKYLSVIDSKPDCSSQQLIILLQRLKDFIEQLSICQKDVIRMLVIENEDLGDDALTSCKSSALNLSCSIIDKKNEIIQKLRKMNVDLFNEANKTVEGMIKVNQDSDPGTSNCSITKDRGKQIVSFVTDAVMQISTNWYKSCSDLRSENHIKSTTISNEITNVSETEFHANLENKPDENHSVSEIIVDESRLSQSESDSSQSEVDSVIDLDLCKNNTVVNEIENHCEAMFNCISSKEIYKPNEKSTELTTDDSIIRLHDETCDPFDIESNVESECIVYYNKDNENSHDISSDEKQKSKNNDLKQIQDCKEILTDKSDENCASNLCSKTSINIQGETNSPVSQSENMSEEILTETQNLQIDVTSTPNMKGPELSPKTSEDTFHDENRSSVATEDNSLTCKLEESHKSNSKYGTAYTIHWPDDSISEDEGVTKDEIDDYIDELDDYIESLSGDSGNKESSMKSKSKKISGNNGIILTFACSDQSGVSDEEEDAAAFPHQNRTTSGVNSISSMSTTSITPETSLSSSSTSIHTLISDENLKNSSTVKSPQKSPILHIADDTKVSPSESNNCGAYVENDGHSDVTTVLSSTKCTCSILDSNENTVIEANDLISPDPTSKPSTLVVSEEESFISNVVNKTDDIPHKLDDSSVSSHCALSDKEFSEESSDVGPYYTSVSYHSPCKTEKLKTELMTASSSDTLSAPDDTDKHSNMESEEDRSDDQYGSSVDTFHLMESNDKWSKDEESIINEPNISLSLLCNDILSDVEAIERIESISSKIISKYKEHDRNTFNKDTNHELLQPNNVTLLSSEDIVSAKSCSEIFYGEDQCILGTGKEYTSLLRTDAIGNTTETTTSLKSLGGLSANYERIKKKYPDLIHSSASPIQNESKNLYAERAPCSKILMTPRSTVLSMSITPVSPTTTCSSPKSVTPTKATTPARLTTTRSLPPTRPLTPTRSYTSSRLLTPSRPEIPIKYLSRSNSLPRSRIPTRSITKKKRHVQCHKPTQDDDLSDDFRKKKHFHRSTPVLASASPTSDKYQDRINIKREYSSNKNLNTLINEIGCDINSDKVNTPYKQSIPTRWDSVDSIKLKSSESDTGCCQLCEKFASVHVNALKCKHCDSFVHFRCSDLPHYCIVSLRMNNLYICAKCVETLKEDTSNQMRGSQDFVETQKSNMRNLKSCINDNLHQSVSDLKSKCDSLEQSVDKMSLFQKKIVEIIRTSYITKERESRRGEVNEHSLSDVSNRLLGNGAHPLTPVSVKNANLNQGFREKDVQENDNLFHGCSHDETIERLELLIKSIREQSDTYTSSNNEKNLHLQILEDDLQATKDKLMTTEENVVKSVEVLQQLVLKICAENFPKKSPMG